MRSGLVAGRYELAVSGEDGLVELGGIDLADGERRELTYAPPDVEVEVQFEDTPEDATRIFIVEGPNLRATWWTAPPRVVPGATLWACAGDACCRFHEPAPRVSCAPSALVRPPMP